MEEYRNCQCIYTTDGHEGSIYGTAIIKIDESRMTMHYNDYISGVEDWRGECKDGEYQLVQVVDGRPTGGSSKLKRVSDRKLTGVWANEGFAGTWIIILK